MSSGFFRLSGVTSMLMCLKEDASLLLWSIVTLTAGSSQGAESRDSVATNLSMSCFNHFCVLYLTPVTNTMISDTDARRPCLLFSPPDVEV
ncbi:hypothetical protein F5Y03DRAFT_369152 [Xylaria venustula]|nr:hypothetical protein F5Y03DRAFT_369152 [Xylaria venustula]